MWHDDWAFEFTCSLEVFDHQTGLSYATENAVTLGDPPKAGDPVPEALLEVVRGMRRLAELLQEDALKTSIP